MSVAALPGERQAFILISLYGTGTTSMTDHADPTDGFLTLAPGLRYKDEAVGEGASPVKGKPVQVHYTGWLDDNGVPGKKFDSSRDRGSPFVFTLGVQQVIAGWDVGVATMKIGGRRRLILAPEMGYGARGTGSVIPPHATLIFDVELLGVG